MAFLDVTLCWRRTVYRRFGETCCLLLRGKDNLRPDYIGRVKRNVVAHSQEVGSKNIGDPIARAHGVTARRTECKYADLFGIFHGISVAYLSSA